MKYLYILCGLLSVAAAFAVWHAFQRPEFVAGLVALASVAAWKAFKPSLKSSPETQEEQRRVREGRERNRWK